MTPIKPAKREGVEPEPFQIPKEWPVVDPSQPKPQEPVGVPA